MFLLSILILVFSLQAIVLDFFLINFLGNVFYVFAILDFLLFGHLVCTFRITNAAYKCTVQWMLYVWLLTIKLGIYYFSVFNDSVSYLDSLSIQEILMLSRSYGFFIIVFLTPIIYIFWASRISKPLFGSIAGFVTVESLMFCDLMSHVIFDLLDCMIAFRLAATHSAISRDGQWIYKMNGVFMLLGLFFHSFSMPTHSSVLMDHGGRSVGKSATIAHSLENDIFLTRKHVALVSIFILDIPLLAVRLLIWKRIDNSSGLFGFNLFVVKNLIDIPLSTFRLNQCRIAEKEHARSQGRKTTPHAPVDKAPSQAIEKASSRGGKFPLLSRPGNADQKRRPDNATCSHLIQEILDHYKMSKRFKMFSEVVKEKMTVAQLRGPCLPVKAFQLPKIIRRITYTLFNSGRHKLAGRLDNSLVLPYWRTMQLAIPLIIYPTVRWVIIGIYVSPVGVQDWSLSSPTSIPFAITLAAGGGVVSTFLGSSKLSDVLFIGAYWVFRTLSFAVTFWILRDSRLLDISSLLRQAGIDDVSNVPWERVCLYALGFPSVISLLLSLFYIQSALLSRRFTYFVVQPRSKLGRSLTYAAQYSQTQRTGPRSDEYGWLSTSSILTFLNCRFHTGPLYLNELLCGPDMIKAIRTSDLLLTLDWYELALDILVKGLCFALVQERSVCFLYLIDIALQISYIVLSQSIRLTAFRRFETKAMYNDLVKACQSSCTDDPPEPVETQDVERMVQVLRGVTNRTFSPKKLEAMSVVLKKYRRQAFLTSPGEIWPPLHP